MFATRRRIIAAKEELSQQAASHKEEVILLRKQSNDQKTLLAASEKDVAECKVALDEEVASCRVKILKLKEDLKDAASLSLLEGEPKLALKVARGQKSVEDCQRIVDYYVGNIGEMADLLSSDDAAEAGEKKDDEPAVDSLVASAEDVLDVAPRAQLD